MGSRKFSLYFLVFFAVFGMAVFLLYPFSKTRASGATLYLSPTSGSFVSESTFDVSILVNTGGVAINAVSADLTFSPDQLQIVGPDSSSSFISTWVAQPSFSNTEGKINLVGGWPNPGVNSSAGNILTIKFRVKGSGQARIHFTNASKVLANDGSGTDILSSTNDAVYNITAKPPGGPIISSTTHPDQNSWYSSKLPQFTWESPGANAISYVYDKNPNVDPDGVAESFSTSISATADSDGIWFLHLKVQTNGVWGWASHFKTQIDSTPPAAFTPKVEPSQITLNQRPIVTFQTTDTTSGVDHYEVKAESLGSDQTNASFFTEQVSPYILPVLSSGEYQISVKAYDKAGNLTESSSKIQVIGNGVADLLHNIWFLIGLGVILLAIILLIVWPIIKRKRRMRQNILYQSGPSHPDQNEWNNYQHHQ